MFLLHRLSLRTTVAALLLLAFAVMGAIYYYQAAYSRRAIVHEVTSQLLHDVKLMKEQHNLLVQDVGHVLLDMVDGVPPAADEDGCRQWLARQRKRNRAFGELHVASVAGEIVCSSQPGHPPISIADRGYFQRALKTRAVVVSQLLNSRFTGGSVIVSAIAARDRISGFPQAVYFVTLDIDRLVEQFLGRHQPHSGRLVVQDDQGNVLARYPDVEHLSGTNRADSPLFKAVTMHGEEGVVEVPGLDGMPHVYVFTTLQQTAFGRLYLIFAISKREAEAAAQNAFYVSLSVGGLALLFLMVAVYWGGNQIFVRRIEQMNRAVDRLARGDLSARTGFDGAPDEIGRLARSFDDMAATIQRKDQEIGRVARARRVVSAGNRCMLHSHNERDLYEQMCEAVVTNGGYRLASVGIVGEPPSEKIRAVGFYGPDRCFADDWERLWAENHSDGITRDAMRRREAVIARHLLASGAPSWRQAIAMRYGYESVAALPLLAGDKTIGVLVICAQQPDAFEDEEVALLQELAGDLSYGMVHLNTRRERDRIVYEHRHHEEILRQALGQTVQTIAATVEMRDPYTAGHQRRVAKLASAIARTMGLSEENVEGVKFAAILHDVGKITIPAEILAKPAALSDIEWMFVRTHPKAGYDILKDVKFPWPIADIILQHHERLDGSGYPRGLKGDQILLESRILAVADIVEAMMSHRPYRASLGVDAALGHIRKQSHAQLDPAVTEACLKVFQDGFAFET